MKKTKTRDLVLCALFVALIAVGAFIHIPTPLVPVSLQYLCVMLAGLILGGKLGAASCFIYMMLGLIGVPIFTHGGGPGYVFQPSFGYIIGFVVGAFVIGTIAYSKNRPSFLRVLAANISGMLTVYIFGMVYYYLMSMFYLNDPIGLWPLFLHFFLMTIPVDTVYCILCAVIAKRLIPMLKAGRV